MVHKRSAALERSVKLFTGGLKPVSRLREDIERIIPDIKSVVQNNLYWHLVFDDDLSKAVAMPATALLRSSSNKRRCKQSLVTAHVQCLMLILVQSPPAHRRKLTLDLFYMWLLPPSPVFVE